MRGVLFLLLCITGLGSGVRAQDSIRPPDEAVTLRAFDAERIAAYKADPEFQYDRDLIRVPTLWERFKEWLGEWLERLFGSRAGSFITQNLLYIISAGLVIFAIVVLSRGSLRKVFHGAPRSLGEVTTVEEDIRGMDLGAMIRGAEAAGDLRRAIRLHYLLVLRKLVDQGVLHWSPEHTDREYMAQIKDPSLRSRFAHVALVFQWVWYGHAEVEPVRYAALREPFIAFEQQAAA
ncbi:MAG TPA: DUF4129 domain-containing protein [Flavobacteriales bacterium]|nr:DUF4129 domain-containing protein [Flavobacteriales bacterium]